MRGASPRQHYTLHQRLSWQDKTFVHPTVRCLFTLQAPLSRGPTGRVFWTHDWTCEDRRQGTMPLQVMQPSVCSMISVRGVAPIKLGVYRLVSRCTF